MIDLSYHPKKQSKGWEPEEIAMAIFAIGIMIVNVLLFVRAL